MSETAWCPKGVDIAADILSRSVGDFCCYGDPDVDGIVSGTFSCMMLSAFGKKYERYLNENRAHGFFMSEENLNKWSGKTIIAVDFAITPDKLEMLRQHRIKLVNIDHHEVHSDKLITYSFDGSDTIDGVVINNQYEFEPEEHRYLSGAGVVYYTFSNMFSQFDNKLTRSLVGLTLLSDIRPLENPNAEAFLRDCYTCREPFMQHLIDITRAENDYNFGVPLMERNYVDYTFSPQINALLRLNMGMLAWDLFMGASPSFPLSKARDIQRAICDHIDDNLRNPFNTNHLIDNLEGLARRGIWSHTKKGTDEVIEEPNVELDCLRVMYVPDEHISDTYLLSNFIGLTCSHLKGMGKSTITYVGDDQTVLRGSFRGRYDGVNYLEIFRRNDVRCDGHKNAFGILTCKLSDINFGKIAAEILEAEKGMAEKEYENRIVEVSNLATFLRTDLLKQIAMTNIYVRDSYRVYLKYTGNDVTRKVVGKMWKFLVDDVEVKCFDENLTTDTGYILPIYDRRVLTLYLKNIKHS